MGCIQAECCWVLSAGAMARKACAGLCSALSYETTKQAVALDQDVCFVDAPLYRCQPAVLAPRGVLSHSSSPPKRSCMLDFT